MQEHEYRARDKTVKKMSRDGLKEEICTAENPSG